MKLLLTGLPAQAQEDKVAMAMGKLGPVGQVTIYREGDADTAWAVVEMAISQAQALDITRRVSHIWVEGRSITITIMTH